MKRAIASRGVALVVALALFAIAIAACRPSEPRALVLVDASAHAAEVEALARSFEASRHRAVRVLHVDRADEGLRLAARGEADVALLPEATPLADFVKREDGKVVAALKLGDESLEVVEVNATMHRTVDAEGAHALATAIAAR